MATLEIIPNVVPAYTTVRVRGTGYNPEATARSLEVLQGGVLVGSTPVVLSVSGGVGSFDHSFVVGEVGSYILQVREGTPKGKGKKAVVPVVASASLTVV